ncbi:MAG TPA: decaprenyl-phosphate phosphoribosyltransferase [Fimbriimonadaceae bacterium]|nr:decaprenyl-phosphate phosphoribosyltransferase [Fimbriimonadaceae bacterium]
MSAWIRLLRPKQWTKNLLVFAALLFTKGYQDPALVQLALLAFVVMCMVSSATYILNDLADVERDRKHPVKQFRPIASGKVPKVAALVLAIPLLFGGVAIASTIGTRIVVIVGVYMLLQGVYNLGLKRVPVTDVFLLSIGFVLRAALGAAAISVSISGWLLFCTGALALLLGFGKRRSEFVLQGSARVESRESLGGYNLPSLDALVLMSATGAAMCYGVYAVESPTARQYPALILTSLFVFYGICRYVFLVFSKAEGGEPETLLLKDMHLIISILGFLASAVLALSGFQLPLVEGL